MSLDIDPITGCIGGNRIIEDLDDNKWCFHKRGDVYQDTSKNKCVECNNKIKLMHKYHDDAVLCHKCFRFDYSSTSMLEDSYSDSYSSSLPRSPPINIPLSKSQ